MEIEVRAAGVRTVVANPALRVGDNVSGPWFVDSTCIDCDACRQIAPAIFEDAGGHSAVYRQPQSAVEVLAAQKALLSCPTSSIGSTERTNMAGALAAYPEQIDGDVYRCGFTAESSFGAFSYLIRREGRNLLIDSPRFAGPLVKNITAMGGVARILLTHRDDVADHALFHERFGCDRVLHRDDVGPRTASIEIQPEGLEPIEIEPDLLMIPTPGHTRGHAVFLYRERILFTGDHLAWNERRERLYAFRNACWYSWDEQIRSMERLLAYRFEHVLPGHGRPIQLEAMRMHDELERCIDWMRARASR